MYKFSIVLLFLISCTTSNRTINTNNLSEEQIFIENETMGKSGKCYGKVIFGDTFKWAEIICPNRITKALTNDIHLNLQRWGFTIHAQEVSKSIFGATTKSAIKQFQIDNNLAYGCLDWATVNRLKKIN